MTVDADEYLQLVETTAHLLEDTEPAALPATLAELGWFELWAQDQASAARALFGGQGRSGRTSPMLSLLIGSSLNPDIDPESGVAAPALLPSLSAPPSGWTHPAGNQAVRALVQVDALSTAGAVMLALRQEDTARILRLDASALSTSTISGLDPDLRLATVDATGAVASADVLMSGTEAEVAWAQALALGRRVVAEELAALVAEQLRLALEHAKSRTQFGRPIGSYQAVKHKLVDTHVALQVARLATAEAWHDPDPHPAMMAKMLAGDAAEIANRHCQQVLGGIGFTWEHSFHRHARRSRMLNALLGSTAQLATDAGAHIVAEHRLPPATPLTH